MEQDRTPPLLVHHPELARQTAGQLPGHHRSDRATTTTKGLRVQSVLDENRYEKGRKVSGAELATVILQPDEFHGESNYTIIPRALVGRPCSSTSPPGWAAVSFASSQCYYGCPCLSPCSSCAPSRGRPPASFPQASLASSLWARSSAGNASGPSLRASGGVSSPASRERRSRSIHLPASSASVVPSSRAIWTSSCMSRSSREIVIVAIGQS